VTEGRITSASFLPFKNPEPRVERFETEKTPWQNSRLFLRKNHPEGGQQKSKRFLAMF
jgi:hypothetical protein